MEKDKRSMTALGTAYMRAHHYAYDEPKIFTDSVAHLLLTDPEREGWDTLFINSLKQADPALLASCPDRRAAVKCAMRTLASPALILARAHYAEARLTEAIGNGIGQYVLIGAGMDTFAFRQPDPHANVQVFEIDHPATQAFKRQRLREVGLEPPPNLHFIAIDLARESLAMMLSRSAYQPSVPAFFAWLGVTMYLTCDAIFETLRSLRSVAATGSQLVFDYIDTTGFEPDRASERIQRLMETARRLGEPMLSGFDPYTLGAELLHFGFRLLENLSPRDLEARYFQGRTDGFHAAEHFYFAYADVE